MYEQIYSLTCMFFKSLKGNLMYEFLLSRFNGRRGSKRQLSLEQIVALNIYRFHFKTGDLKNYHKMIKELMQDKVPNLPNYIPNTLTKNKTPPEHRLIIRNLKGEDPDAIYCFDIHRNGKNKYGENNKRSSWNSQKACLLRNKLYERFKIAASLSFYFSKNPNDEKTDEQIILQLAKR